MKILLFTSFGGPVPDFITNFCKETDSKSHFCRFGEIIDKIEAEAVTDISDVTVSDLRRIPNAIYRRLSYSKDETFIKSVTTYVGWCSTNNNAAFVDIVDYDETKRYVISNYDGSESLECLDDYICIDKEHNIWSKSQCRGHLTKISIKNSTFRPVSNEESEEIESFIDYLKHKGE